MKSVFKIIWAVMVCSGWVQTVMPEKQPVKAVKAVDTNVPWTIEIVNPDKPDEIISRVTFKKDTNILPGLSKGLVYDFGPFGTDTNQIYVYKRAVPKGEKPISVLFEGDLLLMTPKEVQGEKGKNNDIEKAIPGSEIAVFENEIKIKAPKKIKAAKPAAIIVAKGSDMQGEYLVKMDFSEEQERGTSAASKAPTVISKKLGKASNASFKISLKDSKIQDKPYLSFNVYQGTSYSADTPARWELVITDATKDQRLEVFQKGLRLLFNDAEVAPVALPTKASAAGTLFKTDAQKKEEAAKAEQEGKKLIDDLKEKIIVATNALTRAQNKQLDSSDLEEINKRWLTKDKAEKLLADPTLRKSIMDKDEKWILHFAAIDTNGFKMGDFIRARPLLQPLFIEELVKLRAQELANIQEQLKEYGIEPEESAPLAIHEPMQSVKEGGVVPKRVHVKGAPRLKN